MVACVRRHSCEQNYFHDNDSSTTFKDNPIPNCHMDKLVTCKIGANDEE